MNSSARKSENYGLIGSGSAIHWHAIDEDLSVEGMSLETHADVFVYCPKNGPSRAIRELFYLTDFINVIHTPRTLGTQQLIDYYQKHNLSASQIEERTGLAKQAVLTRLRCLGIFKTPNKGRSPNNYRFKNPPYGFKVLNEQLIPNSREMRTVRLIVQLRDINHFKWTDIISHLNEKQIKTRTGKIWNRTGIKRVHKRWSGKI